MAKITQKFEIFVKEDMWCHQYRSSHREYYWRMHSFVRGPALLQCYAALNVDLFQKPHWILLDRFNSREYDTKGLIIDAKWPAKFEKFADLHAQTLSKLSEPIKGVGEARLLLRHGQHDRAHAHLACDDTKHRQNRPPNIAKRKKTMHFIKCRRLC